MNIASAVKEPALQADFFDEKGLLKENTNQNPCMFSQVHPMISQS